jgi:CubicO group peptidase (beta-lactamase class C family)
LALGRRFDDLYRRIILLSLTPLVQYLKPVSGFRTKYDYDNLLYIVAGEVIHVVSGKSWGGDFIERVNGCRNE